MGQPIDATSPIAIVVAVGPDPLEIDRLRDLAESIVRYETGPAALVLIDDAPEPRHLQTLLHLPASIKAVSLHHPRYGAKVTFTRGKGICSAIMLALQWTHANTDALFVTKLDTDSLVISPFRERLTALFEADRSLGMVGAYMRTPNGSVRDWSHHVPSIRDLAGEFDWRRPIRSLQRSGDPARRHMASLLHAARANHYKIGEHCMGGGYALSRELLERMAKAGYLADPLIWRNADVPEDVLVGLHVRAVGLGFADAVAEHEVFGVRYQGLAFPPAELASRGYSIIHAVKNDSRFSEADIRRFFKERRSA